VKKKRGCLANKKRGKKRPMATQKNEVHKMGLVILGPLQKKNKNQALEYFWPQINLLRHLPI